MIDVHILTMPNENPVWLSDCLNSLKSEPVTVHVVPGILDDIGKARAEAFKLGESPYVSLADPDDLVLPGGYKKCLDVLEGNSNVAVVYTHEYVVGENLVLKDSKVRTEPHHFVVFVGVC